MANKFRFFKYMIYLLVNFVSAPDIQVILSKELPKREQCIMDESLLIMKAGNFFLFSCPSH
jgi:hypothetical protein